MEKNSKIFKNSSSRKNYMRSRWLIILFDLLISVKLWLKMKNIDLSWLKNRCLWNLNLERKTFEKLMSSNQRLKFLKKLSLLINTECCFKQDDFHEKYAQLMQSSSRSSYLTMDLKIFQLKKQELFLDWHSQRQATKLKLMVMGLTMHLMILNRYRRSFMMQQT